MPLLVDEESSADMDLQLHDDPVMAVWWATAIECVSAICRLEREQALPRAGVAQALDNLDELKASWHEVQPVEQIRTTARRLLRLHPLRAADVLQLAAALAVAEHRPETLTVMSLDDRLNTAAEKEGVRIARRLPKG